MLNEDGIWDGKPFKSSRLIMSCLRTIAKALLLLIRNPLVFREKPPPVTD